MPRLEAEYTGFFEGPHPTDGFHALRVIDSEQDVAVYLRFIHGIGLVRHLPCFQPMCDGMVGVDDFDLQVRNYVRPGEFSILNADQV